MEALQTGQATVRCRAKHGHNLWTRLRTTPLAASDRRRPGRRRWASRPPSPPPADPPSRSTRIWSWAAAVLRPPAPHELVVALTSWVPGGPRPPPAEARLPLAAGVRRAQRDLRTRRRPAPPGEDPPRGRRRRRRPRAFSTPRGTTNRGIRLGNGVFLGRGTILSCKDGDITLGDHVNIGFHSEIFSGSQVTVGRHGLFAAYTYLVGGGPRVRRTPACPWSTSSARREGITLGENVWLGAGAKVHGRRAHRRRRGRGRRRRGHGRSPGRRGGGGDPGARGPRRASPSGARRDVTPPAARPGRHLRGALRPRRPPGRSPRRRRPPCAAPVTRPRCW